MAPACPPPLPVHRQAAAGVAEAQSGREESGPAEPSRPPAGTWRLCRAVGFPSIHYPGFLAEVSSGHLRPDLGRSEGPTEEVGRWVTVSPHLGSSYSLDFPTCLRASSVGDVPRPCAPECHHPTPHSPPQPHPRLRGGEIAPPNHRCHCPWS